MLSISEIKKLDENDPLAYCRELFFNPGPKDNPYIYMCGNSLGLQLKSIPEAYLEELNRWAKHGKQGWWEGDPSWFTMTEYLSKSMARIVGAKANEVTVMNTLTINIHLLLSKFYNPSGKKTKILMERGAFSSDHHAIQSQINQRNLNLEDHIIYIESDSNNSLISNEAINEIIKEHHSEIALVFLGGVNYYTGQVLDMMSIGQTCHEYNILLGLDLAHATGNVKLELRNWGVDFAVWCTYKYLNSGPGGPSAIFIHEKHHDHIKPALHGWWGHEEQSRFQMDAKHVSEKGAAGWQVSTPQVLNYIGLRENLKLFDSLTLEDLYEKRKQQNQLMDQLIYSLQEKGKSIKLITPKDSEQRGAQCSISLQQSAQAIHEKLQARGVICDWRNPNVIRLSPVPLYNSYTEILNLYNILDEIIE